MRILGHEFRPMTAEDYEGLAGAESGSFICELEDTILVWTPAKAADGTLLVGTHGTLSELYNGGESQRDWTARSVI